MKLSIIVPVYNEEQNLDRVVTRLMHSECPIEREWIFVDDGSSDKSLAILKDLSDEHHFKVLAQEKNQGKGLAVRRGFAEASGDFVMIQDADFEYDPKDIPSLLEPLLEDKADIVYGSRFKKSSPQVHRTYHYFANRFLTAVSNVLSGIYLTDNHTCYKIIRADLLKSMNLKSRQFEIDIELTAYLGKIRPRIYELPISYFPRTRLQGKKIGWKDGVAALYYLVRFNLFTTFEGAYLALPPPYRNRSEKK